MLPDVGAHALPSWRLAPAAAQRAAQAARTGALPFGRLAPAPRPAGGGTTN